MAEETGILGKIGKGIGGILGHPFVQGLGGAAAFGANPILGLLAGSMLKGSREQRELDNEVTRQGLTASRRREGGISDLKDLLGGSVPTDRLLDVEGGPSQIIQSATPGGTASLLSTPRGQDKLLQGLLDINPEAASKSLLDQQFPSQRSDPSILRIADRLDMNGAFANEQAKNAFIMKGGTEAQVLADERELLRLKIGTAQIDFDNATRDQQAENKSAAEQKRLLDQSIVAKSTSIQSLAQLVSNLDDTVYAPGRVGQEARRTTGSIVNEVKNQFGVDTQESDELLADAALLRKGLTQLVIDSIDQFGNNLSGQKLATLEAASANPDIPPEAIIKILSIIAPEMIAQADAEGVPLENREFLENFIKNSSTFLSGGGSPQTGVIDLSNTDLMGELTQ
jgi:hypothetical protein